MKSGEIIIHPTKCSALHYKVQLKVSFLSSLSYPVMEKADSKRRIAVNLFLVAFCGFGSMIVVYNVKKNLQNNTQQNIYAQNSQRYQQDEK